MTYIREQAAIALGRVVRSSVEAPGLSFSTEFTREDTGLPTSVPAGAGTQQLLSRGAQPRRNALGGEQRRHAVVNAGHLGVGLGGQDGERRPPVRPRLVQAGHQQQLPIRRVEPIGRRVARGPVHSKNPSAGTTQRRRANASENMRFCDAVSERALISSCSPSRNPHTAGTSVRRFSPGVTMKCTSVGATL